MGTHPIVARFRAPKQRITRRYEIVMIYNPASKRFCVSKADVHDGTLFDDHYDLDAEQAWERFSQLVQTALQYGAGTWDMDALEVVIP